MIREKTQAMERSSLTMKEEKAALAEMKRMRDDSRKMTEWEAEMDDNRNKRTHASDQLRQLFDEMDANKDSMWYEEVSAKLGVPKDNLNDMRLPVSDGMQEMLSTTLWKKRLQVRARACGRRRLAPQEWCGAPRGTIDGRGRPRT